MNVWSASTGKLQDAIQDDKARTCAIASSWISPEIVYVLIGGFVGDIAYKRETRWV